MITFKDFLLAKQPPKLTDFEVANIYFNGERPVREIAKNTNRSIGEIYRIIKNYGSPNRLRNGKHHVISLADSGLNNKIISDFTGYSQRQVRNIIKNGSR